MSGEPGQNHFQQLLCEVQNGSEEASRELYETYGPHILRSVRSRLSYKMRALFDSEDFSQIVWKSIFDDRAKLAEFQTPKDLTNYLLAIARNKVALAGRSRQ